MTEGLGAAYLPAEADLRAVDALRSADVLVSVCALNQARTAASVVGAASVALATLLADRKSAIVVVEAGFRTETLDAVNDWMAAHPPAAPLCCVRIPGPPRRSQVLLGALAIARRVGAPACILVDAGLISLTPQAVGRLAAPILDGTADCVSPAYSHTVAEGTLTTNLLAPMCRALYGRRVQQLLGSCAGLSQRVVTRLLETDIRDADLTEHAIEILLALEALTAGDRIVEAHLGRKTVDAGLPAPDVATVLAQTVGPFFRLMDRYHGVWSEIAGSTPVPRIGESPSLLPEVGEVAVDRLVRAFKLGLKDLAPVWEQALREETLAALYPLGLSSADEFIFPAEQWARVIFDFAVAYHEQRLPRDHLIRALTPLYLGRVAAFLVEMRGRPSDGFAAVQDAVGRAFEIEKAGLIDRWR